MGSGTYANEAAQQTATPAEDETKEAPKPLPTTKPAPPDPDEIGEAPTQPPAAPSEPSAEEPPAATDPPPSNP